VNCAKLGIIFITVIVQSVAMIVKAALAVTNALYVTQILI
jgi:hypothetical protein